VPHQSDYGRASCFCYQLESIKVCCHFSKDFEYIKPSLDMPTSRHVQKSQEYVYVKKGRGNRARYKPVAVDLPQIPKASAGSASILPDQITIISAGDQADTNDDFPSISAGEDGFNGNNYKKTGKVSAVHSLFTPVYNALQKQSDYMKHWLEEKRVKYLNQILQMKAGSQKDPAKGGEAVELRCPRCNFGRPIWRCSDCMNKSAVCVLCCRDAHKINVLHQIEKWNGRFYQAGGLWQVGVKIHTGHEVHPCPRSMAALINSARKTFMKVHPNEQDDKINSVAMEFGIMEVEVLQNISESLDTKSSMMTHIQKDILCSMAEKSGVGVLDLLEHLKEAVSSEADEVAEALQIESDHLAADAEQIEETYVEGPQVVINIMDEDLGGDDDWEDEDEWPAKGDLPHFLPRPPPTDGSGNPFITVVHTNGFHSLPVVWCACSDHLEDRDMQLLDLHMYPTSYD